MTPIYIIPARGGSKGIPRKNIKEFNGKPLIAYTIDAAKVAANTTGGYILISTDDAEIADVARNCGIPVDYMRPKALATDTAGSREVILDALQWADDNDINYDVAVLLQPTSPLRTADDILATIAAFSADIDMAVTVVEADSNPYYTLFEKNKDGYLHVCKGDGMYTSRQSLPKVWEYNGAVYAINPKSIRTMPLGEFQKRVPVEMPRERSIDIDTHIDWLIAETLLGQK